jgi:hypothetical protein
MLKTEIKNTTPKSHQVQPWMKNRKSDIRKRHTGAQNQAETAPKAKGGRSYGGIVKYFDIHLFLRQDCYD